MQERAVLSLKWLYLGNCLFKPHPSQRSSVASSVPMPIQSPTMVVHTSVAKSSQNPSLPMSQPQLYQEPHGQLTIMSKPNQIVVSEVHTQGMPSIPPMLGRGEQHLCPIVSYSARSHPPQKPSSQIIPYKPLVLIPCIDNDQGKKDNLKSISSTIESILENKLPFNSSTFLEVIDQFLDVVQIDWPEEHEAIQTLKPISTFELDKDKVKSASSTSTSSEP